MAATVDDAEETPVVLTERGGAAWSAAQLRDKQTPAYVEEEFIRVLSEYPIPECVSSREMTARKPAAE